MESTSCIGRGAYTLPEMARYTGLSYPRVRSWFQKPIWTPDYHTAQSVGSFHDMLEVYVFGRLRQEGISLQTLRKAHQHLKVELNTEHPFCHAKLATDGKKIFLRGNKSLVEVFSRQHFIERVLSPFLRKIDFDKTTQAPLRWRIAQGVLIDPCVGFGNPVVKNTGTTTLVLAKSYLANGKNANKVADLFRLKPVEVLNAYRFEAEYGLRKAA